MPREVIKFSWYRCCAKAIPIETIFHLNIHSINKEWARTVENNDDWMHKVQTVAVPTPRDDVNMPTTLRFPCYLCAWDLRATCPQEVGEPARYGRDWVRRRPAAGVVPDRPGRRQTLLFSARPPVPRKSRFWSSNWRSIRRTCLRISKTSIHFITFASLYPITYHSSSKYLYCSARPNIPRVNQTICH